VIHTGKRDIVFVDAGGGKYSPREVITGASGEGNVVEIKQGLMRDEMVVVSAQFMLDSESKTQEAIQKMLKSKEQQGMGVRDSTPPSPDMKGEDKTETNMNMTPDKKANSTKEVYTCPMDEHGHVLQVGPGKCPECGMKLVQVNATGRKVYTCPMEEHHNVLSDKPGKCPECGMELVPMESR
jgi:predicted Zn-ribbon and HTH transcriptional regulator